MEFMKKYQGFNHHEAPSPYYVNIFPQRESKTEYHQNYYNNNISTNNNNANNIISNN